MVILWILGQDTREISNAAHQSSKVFKSVLWPFIFLADSFDFGEEWMRLIDTIEGLLGVEGRLK
jgi:hypothetical protein